MRETACIPMVASILPASIPDSGRSRATEKSLRLLFQEQALEALGQPISGPLNYWRSVLEHGSAVLAPNLQAQAGWLDDGAGGWPVTIQPGPCGNSYPASLITQYVDYPRTELEHLESLTPSVRLAGRLGLTGLDCLLRIARADRVVQWNSWLMSTNLPPAGTVAACEEVTSLLRHRYADHAILLKNVDPMESVEWVPTLRRAGYELLTSRMVYHFDGRSAGFKNRSTVKRDLKEFAADPRFRWIKPEEFSVGDAPRIAQLYRQLYLEKHSALNPQYSETFVRRALRGQWLEFHGLRDTQGVLVGVFGFFTLGGTTSVPFIGYDTEMPQEAGLYRRLFSGILRLVAERGQHLNYSSGAGEFKQRRGGVPVIEFNAVYCRHLGPTRRMAFRTAAQVLNRYVRSWLEANPQ